MASPNDQRKHVPRNITDFFTRLRIPYTVFCCQSINNISDGQFLIFSSKLFSSRNSIYCTWQTMGNVVITNFQTTWITFRSYFAVPVITTQRLQFWTNHCNSLLFRHLRTRLCRHSTLRNANSKMIIINKVHDYV